MVPDAAEYQRQKDFSTTLEIKKSGQAGKGGQEEINKEQRLQRDAVVKRLDDLVAALRAGEIAGAGLDVFEQEPLPADHPLWTMPGVLITPHTAGHGPYLEERRFEVLSDNARRFVAGEELRNIVDKARWF